MFHKTHFDLPNHLFDNFSPVFIKNDTKTLFFQRVFPRITLIGYQTIILSLFRKVVSKLNQLDSLKNAQDDPIFYCFGIIFLYTLHCVPKYQKYILKTHSHTIVKNFDFATFFDIPKTVTSSQIITHSLVRGNF